MGRKMIKVMHIDGDTGVREMVDMVLCLTGEFVVMPCETGQEAIEQLSVFGPEVILMDMKRLGGEAPQTLAAIHADPEFRNTPIIVMTGEAQPVQTAELQAAGAADVITEPFDPMSLADRIKDAIPAYA